MDKLRAKCNTLESELRDPAKFKDFYHFTFNYAKNPGQKGLGEKNVYIIIILNSNAVLKPNIENTFCIMSTVN